MAAVAASGDPFWGLAVYRRLFALGAVFQPLRRRADLDALGLPLVAVPLTRADEGVRHLVQYGVADKSLLRRSCFFLWRLFMLFQSVIVRRQICRGLPPNRLDGMRVP